MHFADAAAWESWLAEHHQTQVASALEIAKERAPITPVTAAQRLKISAGSRH